MDKERSQNPGVTAIIEISNRGHSLTIDSDRKRSPRPASTSSGASYDSKPVEIGR
jgi:hypothetical protein